MNSFPIISSPIVLRGNLISRNLSRDSVFVIMLILPMSITSDVNSTLYLDIFMGRIKTVYQRALFDGWALSVLRQAELSRNR